MAEWNHLIQQSITAGQQSAISHIEQRIQFSPPQHPLYFDMEIAEASPRKFQSERVFLTDKEQLQSIKPGNYQVRVRANLDRSFGQHMQQWGVMMTPDVEIRLSCMASSDVHVEIDNPLWSVPLAVPISSLKYIFRITIPEECATCTLVLELRCHESNAQNLQEDWEDEIVTRLTVRLEGTYNVEDKPLLTECKIALDTPLPEQTAILHVKQSNQDKLCLIGWSRRGTPLETGVIDRIAMSLADFVEQKVVPPEDVIGQMRKFSRQSPATLKRWLVELLKRYGEQLCLVIVDHTDFETPWEMLEIGDEKYLGAHAVVVRWMNVPYPIDDWYHPTYWHELKVSPQQQQGSVIAYLDDKELGEKQTYAERSILKELSVKHCVSLEEWILLLSNVELLTGVGLVYLGCHGRAGRSVGSQHNPSERISNIDLDKIPIVHPHPRPLFFVNACDSGRLKRDSNSSFSGLVEVLLARSANGYIGTLGQVGSTCASLVAEKLLRAASAHPDGVQIAEQLRRLRAEAASRATRSELQHLGQKEKEQRQKELIYTFMYVYYGNGLMRLRLEREKQVEHECV